MKPRDPRRWLEQSGPETELERSLLEVGVDMQPPANSKDAVWAAMVGAAALGGAATLGGGAAAAASGGASAGGAAAGGAVGGGAVAGGAAAGGAVAGTAGSGAAAGGAGTGGAVAGGAAATTTVATSSAGLGMMLKVSAIVGVLGVGTLVAKGPIMHHVRPAATVQTPAMSDAPHAPPPASPADPLALRGAPSQDSAQPPALAPELVPAPEPALPRGIHSSPAASPRSNPSRIPEQPRVNPSPPPESAIALPPAISTLSPEARIASPDVSATPAPAAPPSAQPNPSDADDATDGPNGLADEAATVRAARQELRQGHARAARARLEKAASMFPDGALEEERRVLYIEALVKTGSLARAKSETADFLRAHPNSPHAARLRSLFGR